MLKVADQNETTFPTAAKSPERAHRQLRHVGIFVLCISAAALFAGLDSSLRLSALRTATRVQTAETAPGQSATALPASERSTILFPPAIDARWWVIHAEEAARQATWRIRDTKLDNAPEGREVHWSSGPIWILRAIAGFFSIVAGGPADGAIQEAALWFGPVTLALAAVLLSLPVGIRFGWGYAGFLVLILATSLPVYSNFRVGEPDHHGLVLVALLGCILNLVAGGAGIVQGLGNSGRSQQKVESAFTTARARRYFAVAGVLGGAGMWISAATAIPALVGCGIGALAAAGLHRRGDANGLALDPGLWTLWSRWGAGSCLFFYLLEYFPNHMGWRLEVNHPVYAVAWLGAGGVLTIGCSLLGGLGWHASFMPRLVVAAALLALPILLIAAAAKSVFWVSDPFLFALHQDHIREFGPLLKSISARGDLSAWIDFFAWPLFAILGALLLLKKISSPWPSLLAAAFAPALLMQSLAFAQNRWESVALGFWGACATLVVVAYFQGYTRQRTPLATLLALGALAVLAIAIFPQFAIMRFANRGTIADNLPQNYAPVVLLRDVAHRLVESSPGHIPVVLSDPTSSTELAYFGGISVFGTLYWENLRGLEKSAALFTAPDENTLKERLRAAGVTHIVLPSWDDFTAPTFLKLLRETGKVPAGQQASYLDAVIEEKEFPQWLRPYHYPIPESFGIPNERIHVLEVRFDQTPFDSWLHRGVYYVNARNYPMAQRMLEKAQQVDPSNPNVARWLAAIAKKIPSPQSQQSHSP